MDALRRAVAALPDLDGRTAASKARICSELQRLPHPFDEHAQPVHVTGSAVLVGPCGTVLHRHRRLGLWLQPGGHVDRGETPFQAALRETAEETGLVGTYEPPAPRLVHVDVHPGGRGHTHLDLRYLLHAEGDPAPAAGESQHVRWFDWDEAIALADPGLIAILRHLRPRR